MKHHKHTAQKYRKTAFLWLGLGALIIVIATFSYIFLPKPVQQTNINQQSTTTDTSLRGTKQSPVVPQTTPIPTSYDILVPYAPQAPFSNWTVHEESCEEAAIYMYKGFLENTQYPSNRIADAEADAVFRNMKAWQIQKYGKEPDLTMTALGEFAHDYYGFTPTTMKNVTADDIKEAVAAGHPVIVPVMTHSLENNMYGPTSVYHVLLIKGYDATGVFTNDAGVGNGVNKHYDWNILWQAIDAQTAKMDAGREMLTLVK